VTSSQSRTSVLDELIDGLSLWTLKQPFYHLTVHLIFFNLPSRRLSPLRLSRPGADWIFILLACAERALYSDTSGGDATLRKGYWFWQSSGIL
jgi:hypothetical protein